MIHTFYDFGHIDLERYQESKQMTTYYKTLKKVNLIKAVETLYSIVENLNNAAMAKQYGCNAVLSHHLADARHKAIVYNDLMERIKNLGCKADYIEMIKWQGDEFCRYVSDSSNIMSELGYSIEDFITKTGNYHE